MLSIKFKKKYLQTKRKDTHENDKYLNLKE